MASVDTDKDAVADQVNDVESRWKSLEGEADKASKSLEDKSSKLSEQYDILNDLSKQVKECEDILASHNALGANAYDARSMERVKVNITHCLIQNMFVECDAAELCGKRFCFEHCGFIFLCEDV